MKQSHYQFRKKIRTPILQYTIIANPQTNWKSITLDEKSIAKNAVLKPIIPSRKQQDG